MTCAAIFSRGESTRTSTSADLATCCFEQPNGAGSGKRDDLSLATLPEEIRAHAETHMTEKELLVFRLELDGFGIRRTAAFIQLSETSVRFYRLSAWAKLGKHLVTQQMRSAA